jgi:MSHA biogenesis protein MshO
VTPSDETLGGVSVPVSRIKLALNPFAQQQAAMPSPLQRFQVVSGPVTFYCAKNASGRNDLWRVWGYPITADQKLPTGGKQALVASGVDNCDDIFGYTTAAAQRTGLVRIALSLRGRNENPPVIRLVHQVHVDNTP